MPPSEDDPIDKAAFRRQLDATLRQRDPDALRVFLLASGQWRTDTIPADVEASMWMMILASPALADLHSAAQAWLRAHGHEQEAELLAGRKRAGKAGNRPSDKRSSGAGPRRGGRSDSRRP
jgi:hypothetical protein